ncbi:lipid-A-disaccharide synthase [Thiolapillus brandeum]|uniref:Lipid-A-disaccharide synthase n=1 Tax=Thiolapillus brandeum TaxID=1076588 RepID=A0A7U6JH98_9GAMM|nr:lipid-A-disaccharide synthase [Thiolapillus brandeum]BAO44091.1 lipid-A-disaccharide synthase [Thiolapillus brandeum]
MRIALVAAEPSGDQLAAGLMRRISEIHPGVRFEGIGGEAMLAAGLDSFAPMERLSVMGLVEVLGRLPELLRLRRNLVRHWKDQPPDLFIGVDAPDFNLRLETLLREKGVPTIHYVCPTVWAWRPGRVKKIRRAADLVLSIFPFEKKFLQQHQVPGTYVGHPMAADYPLEPDPAGARAALGLKADAPVLALLPGSRAGEVKRLAPAFLGAAQVCAEQLAGLQVITPLATQGTQADFQQIRQQHAPHLDITLVRNNTRQALEAADVVLVASGTATFEALLCKRPMVVGYRLNALTHGIIRGLNMLQIEHVSMANLLSREPLAGEYLQGDCTSPKLAEALLRLFNDPGRRAHIAARYRQVHEALIMDTNDLAARAVLKLYQGRMNKSE